jgi:hypothetical protein
MTPNINFAKNLRPNKPAIVNCASKFSEMPQLVQGATSDMN